MYWTVKKIIVNLIATSLRQAYQLSYTPANFGCTIVFTGIAS